MKKYSAAKYGIAYVIEASCARQLNPRLDLLSLSPGGFAWGKYGRAGGDHQLALAIFCDAYDDETALRLYEQFAERAIYIQNREAPFVMTIGQVLEHVETINDQGLAS